MNFPESDDKAEARMIRERYFNMVWLKLVGDVMNRGHEVAPRGKPTLELPQHTVAVDMRRPVLTVAERKLNYQFMAAEAYWICSGDDQVETIAPWNKHIAQFSDDGVRFFGAYGPKIRSQLPFVANRLLEDEHSRQAVLTIWRESPPQTKDVPCTVAMAFNIRADPRALSFKVLNAHVFMRSNDVWLGTPYDVFNFSMVAHLVAGTLNHAGLTKGGWLPVEPGTLYLTAASSHLYATDYEKAKAVLDVEVYRRHAPEYEGSVYQRAPKQPETPHAFWNPRGDGTSPEEILLHRLRELRDSKPRDPRRWWETE